MTVKRSDVEIMAPVGCYESLAAAVQAGADSIYFGVEQLNMRARSSFNFTLDDLSRIVSEAGRHGIKTYLTVNTILYDEDLPEMRRIMNRARSEGVDAVIASDQAAIFYARSIGLEVHISTQLNLSNIETVAFYAQYADVVVLARELSLAQVRAIADGIRSRDLRGPKGEPLRIEMFAHGALCMAVSGKCYLSLHESAHSANRGSCRQICRRAYTVRDRESGEELVVDNKYIMSPKDLCTVDFLDRFLDAGVRVLKIEGRAKTFYYVASVTAAYRKAHKKASDSQLVLNLDCVGDGDHIRFFPTKKLKKDRKKLTSLYKACGYFGKKDVLVHEKGFSVYPSDQANFPYGVGICALRKKGKTLYLSRIHTSKDTVLEETNVNILRAALITFIACGAAQ